MTFSIGDQTIEATPGTTVFAPRHVVHSFTIDSEQVRILVMKTPAGLEGFFKELSVPAQSMTLPPPRAVCDESSGSRQVGGTFQRVCHRRYSANRGERAGAAIATTAFLANLTASRNGRWSSCERSVRCSTPGSHPARC